MTNKNKGIPVLSQPLTKPTPTAQVFTSALCAGWTGTSSRYESEWYNHTTNEIDIHTDTPTEEEMRQYLPQDQLPQDLYTLYLQQGHKHLDAYILVLEAILGSK